MRTLSGEDRIEIELLTRSQQQAAEAAQAAHAAHAEARDLLLARVDDLSRRGVRIRSIVFVVARAESGKARVPFVVRRRREKSMVRELHAYRERTGRVPPSGRDSRQEE